MCHIVRGESKKGDEEGNSGVGAGDRDDGNESEPCADGTTPGLAMPLSADGGSCVAMAMGAAPM